MNHRGCQLLGIMALAYLILFGVLLATLTRCHL